MPPTEGHFDESNRIRRSVHIVSLTHRASAMVAERLKEWTKGQRWKLDVCHLIAEMPGVHIDGSRPDATIVVIEPGAIGNEYFEADVRHALRDLRQHEDMRVFVCGEGFTRSEFDAGVSPGSLLEEITENVQLPPSLDIAALEGPVSVFLTDAPHIKDWAARNAIWWPIVRGVGLLAGAAQAAAIAGLVGIVAARSLGMVGSASDLGAPVSLRQLGSLFAGVTDFWALTLPAFYMLRGPAAQVTPVRSDPRAIRWIVSGLAAILFGVAGSEYVGVERYWLWLGLALGALLDAARRSGLQARRAQITMSDAKDADVGRRFGEKHFARMDANPWRCPLWPSSSRHVVISYSRSSAWGCALADTLHTGLAKAGMDVFLDRRDTEVGAGWRRTIAWEIAHADTLIVLMDEVSSVSRWVMSEMESALFGRRLTSSPRVIVVIKSTFQSPDTHTMASLLLTYEGRPSKEGRPRLIRENRWTTATLIGELQSKAYGPITVVPRLIGLSTVLSLPFTALGAASGLASVCAWMIWGADRLWPFLLGRLGSGGATALAILLSYWIGFMMQMAFVARYGSRHDTPRETAAFQAIGLIGLVLFLRVCLPLSTIYAQLWMVVFGALGLRIGAQDRDNAFRTRRRAAERLRDLRERQRLD
jgi:hypothetical protein